MIDQLIQEGQELESEIDQETYDDKFLEGLKFESWAAKAIGFLETEAKGSSLTAKAIDANKKVGGNKYDAYITILGVIQGIKPILEERKKSVEKMSRLNTKRSSRGLEF